MGNANQDEHPQGYVDELLASLNELASSQLTEESLATVQYAKATLDSLSQAIQSNQEATALVLREAQDEKNQFISHVTHELRLPMTSIKGYTDLLRQGLVGPINEQQLNFLDTIRNNVERMSALLSDLSDITRLDGGRLKLDLGSVELKEPLQIALESLHPIQEGKGQKIALSLPDTLPAVWADANRLIQIMTCLLRNAIMYTQEGGEITISAQALNEHVLIQVKDNGIGISPEDQGRLFTPFFRSDEPAVREQYGWGLSLHLSSRLVQLMGGEMGVESVAGKGSTFWFTLPRQNATPKPDEHG